MATVASLLASAEAALDGSDDGFVTALKFFRDAASLAAAQSNYADAITAAQAALALIGNTPDVYRHSGGGQAGMTWSQTQIEAFISRMRHAQVSATGVQTQEVTYEQESDTNTY
jgi:hypothetical protein